MAAQARSKVRFNLESPNGLKASCDLAAMGRWFEEEALALPGKVDREIMLAVFSNLDQFVRFPDEALLMWPGCARRARKYHRYPVLIKKISQWAKTRATRRALLPEGMPDHIAPSK
jgi:hypothetical protein